MTSSCYVPDTVPDLFHLERLSCKGLSSGWEVFPHKERPRTPPQQLHGFKGTAAGEGNPHGRASYHCAPPGCGRLHPDSEGSLSIWKPPPCNLYITFARRLHISPFQASTPVFFCHSNFISWAVWTAGSAVARV